MILCDHQEHGISKSLADILRGVLDTRKKTPNSATHPGSSKYIWGTAPGPLDALGLLVTGSWAVAYPMISYDILGQ